MKIPSMIPVSKCNRSGSQPSHEVLPVPTINARERILTIQQNAASSRYSIRDIFRRHFEGFLQTHDVPFYKERAIRSIMACGTGELGYTLSVCTECGTVTMHADSCGNRNCPSCGYFKQQKWIHDRNADLLDGVPYVHVVFTVPHDLNALIYCNQKVLLNHFFRSVKKTVLDLCMEKYHLVPGLLMVLHTFSSNLSLHYHIHMLATAAGISPDKTSFDLFGTDGYFLPVQKLSKRYRGCFLQGLKELKENGKIEFYGGAAHLKNSYEWNGLVDTCYKKDWNIEIKKYQVFHKKTDQKDEGLTAQSFPGYAIHPPVSPESVSYDTAPALFQASSSEDRPNASIVTDYVSQYAFRTAISDNRIQSYDEETVSFDYKQYHNGNCVRKTMSLKIHEFIRRFLLHILEPGIQRIRYAGFLASCIKEKTLSTIRELLYLEEKADPLKGMDSAELVEQFTGKNPAVCPVCNGKTVIRAHRVKIQELASQSVKSCYMIRGS